MEAYEIKEVIDRVEASKRTSFLMHVESGGYIELSRKKVLLILRNEYHIKAMQEFKTWLESKDVVYRELASKLEVHPVQFTQMLSGDRKSINKISALEFIELVKGMV